MKRDRKWKTADKRILNSNTKDSASTGYYKIQNHDNKDVQNSAKYIDGNAPVRKRVRRCLPQEELKNLLANHNDEKAEEEKLMTLYIYDFAGQHVFYATHMLFHSRKALYLLVFDLSKKFNDIVEDVEDDCLANEKRSVEDCLRFWVNSIHSFVGYEAGTEPYIILVGTHKDKVMEDTEYIKEYFSAIRDLFQGTEAVNHFVLDEYAVNNLDPRDCEFDRLRERIIEIGQQRANLSMVPAKWIQLEKSLVEIKQTQLKRIVSLETVVTTDAQNEVPIADIEHIKLFLKYHHEKGTIFYFDEGPISNCVVLDPQYLIDAFKCIITSARFCKKHHLKVWQVFMKEARLEKSHISLLWEMDKRNNFMEFKGELLAFLNKHHILSEAMFFDEQTQCARGLGWYVVPSLLKNHSSSSEIEKFMEGKRRSIFRFAMKFEYSSIVPTVNYRLISAALGRWPVTYFRDKYLLFQNMSVLRLDKLHCGVLGMNNFMIELYVISLCPSVDVEEKVLDGFRRFSESVVLYEFRKHTVAESEEKNSRKKSYASVYKCNNNSHGMHGSTGFEDISELLETDLPYLPCPDNESHEICTRKAKCEWFLGMKNIPLCVKNDTLTDTLLSKLACAIGRNWEMLGYELGLKKTTIDHIHEDYPGRTVMKIFHMLRKWSINSKDIPTMNRLVNILQKRRDVSVDWDEVRNIIEEENERVG